MQSLGRSNNERRLQVRKCVYIFRLCLFFCHAPRPARCSFEGLYSEQVLCRCLQVNFDTVFSVFQKGFRLPFQTGQIVLIFCCQVAPQFLQNCDEKLRKSAEKFVRTTSYRQQKYSNKIPPQWFRAENVDVHLYHFFCIYADGAMQRYIATQRQQQVSNFVQVVQKWLGTNMFFGTKSHTGSKFSKITLQQLYT